MFVVKEESRHRNREYVQIESQAVKESTVLFEGSELECSLFIRELYLNKTRDQLPHYLLPSSMGYEADGVDIYIDYDLSCKEYSNHVADIMEYREKQFVLDDCLSSWGDNSFNGSITASPTIYGKYMHHTGYLDLDKGRVADSKKDYLLESFNHSEFFEVPVNQEVEFRYEPDVKVYMAYVSTYVWYCKVIRSYSIGERETVYGLIRVTAAESIILQDILGQNKFDKTAFKQAVLDHVTEAIYDAAPRGLESELISTLGVCSKTSLNKLLKVGLLFPDAKTRILDLILEAQDCTNKDFLPENLVEFYKK